MKRRTLLLGSLALPFAGLAKANSYKPSDYVLGTSEVKLNSPDITIVARQHWWAPLINVKTYNHKTHEYEIVPAAFAVNPGQGWYEAYRLRPDKLKAGGTPIVMAANGHLLKQRIYGEFMVVPRSGAEDRVPIMYSGLMHTGVNGHIKEYADNTSVDWWSDDGSIRFAYNFEGKNRYNEAIELQKYHIQFSRK